jgi:hypothetical protein
LHGVIPNDFLNDFLCLIVRDGYGTICKEPLIWAQKVRAGMTGFITGYLQPLRYHSDSLEIVLSLTS